MNLLFMIICIRLVSGFKLSENIFDVIRPAITQGWNVIKNFDKTLEEKTTVNDSMEKVNRSTTVAASFPWAFWSSLKSEGFVQLWFIKECKAPYINFGGDCIVIMAFTKVTWMEAKEMCETNNATLINLKKEMHYRALRNWFIKRVRNLNEGDKHFWIGGHFDSERSVGSSKWTWTDQTDVELKSPVWGVDIEETCNATNVCNYAFNFGSVPQETRKGDCLAMDPDFDHYVSDQNCLEKRYPVCRQNDA